MGGGYGGEIEIHQGKPSRTLQFYYKTPGAQRGHVLLNLNYTRGQEALCADVNSGAARSARAHMMQNLATRSRLVGCAEIARTLFHCGDCVKKDDGYRWWYNCRSLSGWFSA